MRIAFVYDMVYPFKIGGVEKRIWELSRRLARNGNEVHILGLKLWDGPPDIIREGVHIHGVGRKFTFHSGPSGRRAIFPALWFSMALFIPLIRAGKFDIIDCQNFPYFHCFSVKIASYFKKSPLVITWHEVWGPYWKEYLGRFGACGMIVERLVSGLTSSHIVVSKTTKTQIQHIGVKEPISIIPNGLDLERIRGMTLSPDRYDVIFVGRLIWDKHVDILVGAVDLLRETFPDIRCIIVGRGPEEERLKEQVLSADLGKNVEFFGFLDNPDDIYRLIKSSRVCVLPSTREGFGMVALEALGCGTPVVTADHPGNAICDFTSIGGVRVVALTREDFAVAIKDSLLSSSARVSENLESEWDWDAIARMWLEIAEQVKIFHEKSTVKGSL